MKAVIKLPDGSVHNILELKDLLDLIEQKLGTDVRKALEAEIEQIELDAYMLTDGLDEEIKKED